MLLNDEAADSLNEELEQNEILDFLDNKYGVNNLVTQRTIQRWLTELNIECIQPRPKRNRDIRYHKSDILKLEEAKRVNLLRKRNKELNRMDMENIAVTMEERMGDYNDLLASMTEGKRQLDNDEKFKYKLAASRKKQIDKLEMCFNKLFPDVIFDNDRLEDIFYILDEPSRHSDIEYGQAYLDFHEKNYIKNYKD